MSDPSREFTGLATVFDEPPEDWAADAFRPWVELGLGLPMQLDHDVVIFPSGGIKEVGKVTDTALLPETSTHPAGLLVLGHLYPGPVGDAVIEGVRSPYPDGRQWGLSIAAAILHEGASVELAVPFEVSVTLKPVYEQALVLAVAERARVVWDLLAPARAPERRTW